MNLHRPAQAVLQTSRRSLRHPPVNDPPLAAGARTPGTDLQAACGLRSVVAAHILPQQLCDGGFAALIAAVRACAAHTQCAQAFTQPFNNWHDTGM